MEHPLLWDYYKNLTLLICSGLSIIDKTGPDAGYCVVPSNNSSFTAVLRDLAFVEAVQKLIKTERTRMVEI